MWPVCHPAAPAGTADSWRAVILGEPRGAPHSSPQGRREITATISHRHITTPLFRHHPKALGSADPRQKHLQGTPPAAILNAFLPHFSWQRASFSGNNRYYCCSHADRWFIDSVRESVAIKSPRFHICTLQRGDYSLILPRCHYLAAIMMAFLPHCRAGSNHDGISAALSRWQQS